MQNVSSIAAAATIAGVLLAFLQAVLSALRTRAAPDRILPLLLAVLFAACAVLLLAPAGSLLRAAFSICMSWAAGASLIRARGSRGLSSWSAASGAFLVVTLLVFGLGYAASQPFAVFRATGMTLLAVAISRNAWRLRNGLGVPAALVVIVSSWLWLAGGGAGLALSRFPTGLAAFFDLPALPLLLCTGWIVIRRGCLAAPGPDQGSLFARVAATEGALEAQDRLSAAAVLALGAAHEFKNVLAHVKATAQHGLGQPLAGAQQSLRLILEHAEAGRKSAVELLEEAAGAAREEPRQIDAASDLGDLARMARAAFRSQGIVLESDLRPGVVFRARRNEVEQAVLNLVRNAAAACRGKEGIQVIHLCARRDGGLSLLEVRDHAGGVPSECLHGLFSGAHRGLAPESTGLGLYLSKSLAAANDGTLEYEPTADGSIFRLTFASADAEGPSP